ncbi:MAG TPA: DUF2752 domain-containing protein [Holophagaceae bacterium]|nr:DUF2752 domain-containing protein [Holophagaceae bacterium]
MRLVPATRWPDIPRWAAALAAALVSLVLAGVALEQRAGLELDTCLFHRLTGHPCPTCGSTRAVLAILSGHWQGAFQFNPLVTAALLFGSAFLALRLALGVVPRLDLTAGERQGLLATGLLALALNWAYVLRTLG